MDILMATLMDTIASYMWPLFRVSSMFMVMAVFGANTTPVRVRALLSMAITFAIVPVLPPVENVELFAASAIFITLQQLLIGIAMGFVTLMKFVRFSCDTANRKKKQSMR